MAIYYKDQIYKIIDPENFIKCHGNRYLLIICNIHRYYIPIVTDTYSKLRIPEFNRETILITDLDGNYYKFISNNPVPVYEEFHLYPLIYDTLIDHRNYDVFVKSRIFNSFAETQESTSDSSFGIRNYRISLKKLMHYNIMSRYSVNKITLIEIVKVFANDYELFDIFFNPNQSASNYRLIKTNTMDSIITGVSSLMGNDASDTNIQAANSNTSQPSRNQTTNQDNNYFSLCPRCLSDADDDNSMASSQNPHNENSSNNLTTNTSNLTYQNPIDFSLEFIQNLPKFQNNRNNFNLFYTHLDTYYHFKETGSIDLSQNDTFGPSQNNQTQVQTDESNSNQN